MYTLNIRSLGLLSKSEVEGNVSDWDFGHMFAKNNLHLHDSYVEFPVTCRS